MTKSASRTLADKLFPVIAIDDEVEIRNIPPEQRRLHTESSDLIAGSLHQLITNGKIEIPEFQRGYVWNRNQASRLIESLIIQCPIPVIYLSQTPENKLIVIDGNQRLLTIKLYLNDAFALQGLTTYPELNGSSWLQLDPRIRDHINNRTIRCITILKDTHPQIKYDVFERLNIGSVKLNAQELRRGLNYGSLVERIDLMTENPTWRKLVGIRIDKRMRSAELVLRYLALRHDRQHYQKPLSSFLDNFIQKYRNESKKKLEEWTADFEKNVETVARLMGNLAFKIFDDNLKPTGLFNSALYDAQMIGFAETKNRKLIAPTFPREQLHKKMATGLFENTRFMTSIRAATSEEITVKSRINLFRDFLNEF